MYIFVGEYEDDGMGPPLDELVCSCCGKSNSSLKRYTIFQAPTPYRVLVKPMKCRSCGHIDSIVANSKRDFIELTCFSGAYNLSEDRKAAIEREKKDKIESKKRKSVPQKSIIERIKDSCRIAALFSTIVTLLLAIIVLLLVLSVSYFILSISLYKLLGLFIFNQKILLFISASIILTLSVIVEPLLESSGFLFSFASWPVKVNKVLRLSHLMRVILFILITIADLSNTTYFFNLDTWSLIDEVIYPAIVTSLLVESYLKAVKFPQKKKCIDNNQKETVSSRSSVQHQLNNDHNRVVDAGYLDILLHYFEHVTIDELKQFNGEIYDMIKRDFSNFFSSNGYMEQETKVSDIVQWYKNINN